MTDSALERLTAVGISLLPVDIESHYMFERDGFIALVERRPDGFGTIGAAGLVTATGLAPLVWRNDRPVFVNKGSSVDATLEQVELLRRFQADLASAIHP